MNTQCLFCKIVKAEIPSTKVFENENVLGIVDIYPQAKSHFLFLHKKHTQNMCEMSSDPIQYQDIFLAINEFSSTSAFLKNGFRVVTNVGLEAGQSVFHTHFHVLGGEKLGRFGS